MTTQNGTMSAIATWMPGSRAALLDWIESLTAENEYLAGVADDRLEEVTMTLAELAQLEMQLAKVIKAAEAYLQASQPAYQLGSGKICAALKDAIETAKGPFA